MNVNQSVREDVIRAGTEFPRSFAEAFQATFHLMGENLAVNEFCSFKTMQSDVLRDPRAHLGTAACRVIVDSLCHENTATSRDFNRLNHNLGRLEW